jgi:hypothetical protein
VTASDLSPKTVKLLADAQRRRLIEQEGRERKAAERVEVGDGIAERVKLGEDRGEAFTRPKPGTVTRHDPVRRQTGLTFLANAGKLTGEPLKMAARYEAAFAQCFDDAPIRSQLGGEGGGGEGPTIQSIGRAAAARVAAREQMFRWGCELGHSQAMLNALNLILGTGMTPREAGGNALKAAVYTALTLAALDILVANAAARKLLEK